MLLSQFRTPDGQIQVVARDGTEAFEVNTRASLYEIAMDCAREGIALRDRIAALGLTRAVDLEALYAEGRLLPPILHPDPAHLHLTGTGLTHLGSASTRAAMHATASAEETDSMKMFRMGLEGGRPPNGTAGVQPEWFYKGTGAGLVAPGAPLPSPDFAEDGGRPDAGRGQATQDLAGDVSAVPQMEIQAATLMLGGGAEKSPNLAVHRSSLLSGRRPGRI